MRFHGKKNSLGYEAVWLTTSKVVSLMMTMIVSMLLSRLRTLEEYGTYSQLNLVITLFSSIFMLGLPNSISYFLARAETEESKRKFLSVYYILTTFLSILLGGILYVAAPVIAAYFKNPGILAFSYFLFLYPWTNITGSSIENVLIIYKKTQGLIAFRLSNSILQLGAVLLVWKLNLGFREYILAILIISVVFSLLIYFIVWRLSGGFKLEWNWELLKSIFEFSVPMGISSVIGTISIELDKLLIGRQMNTEQLAIYTNASKELPVAFVSASFTAVLLPRIAALLKQGHVYKAVEIWRWAVEIAFVIIALIVFGVSTYAQDVMVLLYSDKYLSGITVFRIYTLVLLARITYFGMILNAMGKTKQILMWSIVSLVLNVVLNITFFHFFGMVGPALATLLAIVTCNLGQLLASSKYLQVSFSKIFPWGNLIAIIGINVIFSVIFYCVKGWLSLEKYLGSIGEGAFLGVIWSVLYFVVMKGRINGLWKKLNSVQ